MIYADQSVSYFVQLGTRFLYSLWLHCSFCLYQFCIAYHNIFHSLAFQVFQLSEVNCTKEKLLKLVTRMSGGTQKSKIDAFQSVTCSARDCVGTASIEHFLCQDIMCCCA